MSVLALDLGSTTGWALKDDNGDISSGVKQFEWEDLGERFWGFWQWLEDMYIEHKIDEVIYEKVYGHKGVYAAHTYGAFQGILLAWCAKNKVTYKSVHALQIKKLFVGHGRAKKEDIIARCRELGFDVSDDNEADAIALLLSQRDAKV